MRGSKPGERRGGRQRGTKNKRTVATERALADASTRIAGALGPDAFEGDAHAVLISVYRTRRYRSSCVCWRREQRSGLRSLGWLPSMQKWMARLRLRCWYP